MMYKPLRKEGSKHHFFIFNIPMPPSFRSCPNPYCSWMQWGTLLSLIPCLPAGRSLRSEAIEAGQRQSLPAFVGQVKKVYEYCGLDSCPSRTTPP
jgi:hypothetical protein